MKSHFDEETELQMVVWGTNLDFWLKLKMLYILPTYLILYSSSQASSDGFFFSCESGYFLLL